MDNEKREEMVEEAFDKLEEAGFEQILIIGSGPFKKLADIRGFDDAGFDDRAKMIGYIDQYLTDLKLSNSTVLVSETDDEEENDEDDTQ